MRQFFLLFIAFLAFPILSQDVVEFKEGWEYSWNYSNSKTNSTKNQFNEFQSDWHSFQLRNPIPDRNGRKILWVRNRLPKIRWERPAMYIPFIDFTYQAFYGNEVIGRFGEISDAGDCRVETWVERQFILLKTEYAGEYIYFKICSPYLNIGIAGVPKLGNIETLYQTYVLSEIPMLVFSIFFCISFMIALYFFSKRSSQRILLYYSLFCLSLSVVCIYHTSFRLEVINSRLFWTKFITIVGVLAPIFLVSYFESLLGSGWKNSITIIRYEMILFAVVTSVAIFLSEDLAYHNVFSVIFFFLCTLNFLIIVYNFFTNTLVQTKEKKILALGTMLMFFSIAPQFFHELGIYRSPFFYFPIGVLFFALGLGWIAGERYSLVYDTLQEYSENLERKVEERTMQIEKANAITLENEKKIAELEKENAVIREREKIFTDIHDHVGSALSDLDFQIRNIKNLNDKNPEIVGSLNASMENLIRSFRSKIHSIEDMKIIEADFINGMRLIVFRRYENAGRRILFHADFDVVEFFLNYRETHIVENIFSIIQEVITNDLKYGEGISEFQFHLDSSFIEIRFRANSNYEPKFIQKGMGTQNIQARIQKIHGKQVVKMANGVYHLMLQIPH